MSMWYMPHPMAIKEKWIIGCSRCGGFHPEGEHTKSMIRFVLERLTRVGVAIGIFIVSIPIWVAFIVFLIRLAQAWGWL